MAYYYDTDKKLMEIFSDHCNLTGEQYEEIRAQFIYLVSDIQEMEPMAEIEKRIGYMMAAFEFLYNTKGLFDKEFCELQDMLEQIRHDAEKEIVRKAAAEGTVL